MTWEPKNKLDDEDVDVSDDDDVKDRDDEKHGELVNLGFTRNVRKSSLESEPPFAPLFRAGLVRGTNWGLESLSTNTM